MKCFALKYYLLICLCLCTTPELNASAIDSCLLVIQNSQNKINISNAFLELSKQYNYNTKQYDEIISLSIEYDNFLDTSLTTSNNKERESVYYTKAKIHQLIAYIYFNKNEMQKAITAYTVSDKSLKKSNMPNLGYGITWHRKIIEFGKPDTMVIGSYIELANILSGSKTDTIPVICKKTQQLINEALKKANSAKRQLLLKQKTTVFQYLSLYYYRQGNLERCLDYINKSEIICKKSNYQLGLAICMNIKGSILSIESSISQGLKLYLKAIQILQNENDYESYASALNNAGANYNDLGMHDSAYFYYNKSLEVRKHLGNNDGIANSLANLSYIFLEQKKITEAKQYLLRALELRKIVNNTSSLAETYYGLCNLYWHEGNFEKAKEYAKISLKSAKSINDNQKISSAANYLSKIENKLGLYDSALVHYNVFINAKNTTQDNEIKERADKREIKYQNEKKMILMKKKAEEEKALSEKDKEKELLISYISAGGLSLTIIFAFIILGRLKISRKQKSTIEDQKSLIEQKTQELTKTHKENQNLLHNILPINTAKELIENNGKVRPKNYKLVTILFTDFKGFTTIAEKISIEELINDLGFLFEKFDKIVEKYNVEKIKTIGDAYMCAGGVPEENTSNPIDVVKAGLAIQKEMETFNANRLKQGKQIWELRVGIHTGPVVAGVVGVTKYSYDLWGDTVNIASRLESAGEVGKINISNATYELVKDRFNCEYRGKLEAKNKDNMDMYFVGEMDTIS